MTAETIEGSSQLVLYRFLRDADRFGYFAGRQPVGDMKQEHLFTLFRQSVGILIYEVEQLLGYQPALRSVGFHHHGFERLEEIQHAFPAGDQLEHLITHGRVEIGRKIVHLCHFFPFVPHPEKDILYQVLRSLAIVQATESSYVEGIDIPPVKDLIGIAIPLTKAFQ